MRPLNNERKIFGENLKLFRKKLGMSVEQFAEYSGIPVSKIYGFERGTTNLWYVSILQLVRILNDFDLSFEDML